VGGLTLPLGEPVPFVLAAAMTLPCVRGVVPRTAGRAREGRRGDVGAALRERNVLALLRADRTLGLIFGCSWPTRWR